MTNTPLRVLMLSKACIVGIYQRKLEEIARLGIELLVLVPPSWTDERGETQLERAYTSGYRLEVIPMVFNGNFHLHYYPAVGGWIREFRPHVVHIDEEPYNLAAWQALVHARRAGAKSLFFTWQNIQRNYPPPFSWGEQWMLNTVNYVIAGTPSAADVWQAKGYKGRTAVIPQFGVDPALFRPSPPTPLPQGEGSRDTSVRSLPVGPRCPPTPPTPPEDTHFTIGYVGRLVEEKGIHLLLQAAARLTGEWRVRIIGSGPYQAELRALAERLGISRRVEWIEWIASTDMPGQYQQLNVLVIPSLTRPNWKEQFGRVITEAMSSGVPVIGSDSGAIPDVIGEAGLIVPEGDVSALAEALQRLQDDADLRARLSEAGRARVLAHFTHEQIARDTVQVYQQMISGDQSGRIEQT